MRPMAHTRNTRAAVIVIVVIRLLERTCFLFGLCPTTEFLRGKFDILFVLGGEEGENREESLGKSVDLFRFCKWWMLSLYDSILMIGMVFIESTVITLDLV